MRVLRERRYKLIMNIAHPLPFPMALDLLKSSTWQEAAKQPTKPYGKRPLSVYLQRPRFELYDRFGLEI